MEMDVGVPVFPIKVLPITRATTKDANSEGKASPPGELADNSSRHVDKTCDAIGDIGGKGQGTMAAGTSKSDDSGDQNCNDGNEIDDGKATVEPVPVKRASSGANDDDNGDSGDESDNTCLPQVTSRHLSPTRILLSKQRPLPLRSPRRQAK